jgi:hypothetical protein
LLPPTPIAFDARVTGRNPTEFFAKEITLRNVNRNDAECGDRRFVFIRKMPHELKCFFDKALRLHVVASRLIGAINSHEVDRERLGPGLGKSRKQSAGF